GSSLLLASLAGGRSAGVASGGASDRDAERALEARGNRQLSASPAYDAAADLRGADDHRCRDLVSYRVGGCGGGGLYFVPLAAGLSFADSGDDVRLRVAVPAAVAAVFIARQDRRIHWRDALAAGLQTEPAGGDAQSGGRFGPLPVGIDLPEARRTGRG